MSIRNNRLRCAYTRRGTEDSYRGRNDSSYGGEREVSKANSMGGCVMKVVDESEHQSLEQLMTRLLQAEVSAGRRSGGAVSVACCLGIVMR